MMVSCQRVVCRNECYKRPGAIDECNRYLCCMALADPEDNTFWILSQLQVPIELMGRIISDR